MNRRDFLSTVVATSLAQNLSFGESGKREKQAIIVWLGGGCPTIDLWDMKPGTKEGGPFSPINTTGDFQICEHLPLLAQRGKDFSLIRSMSTREADHMRGDYYLHTGFVPNPNIVHPSIGCVVAKESSSELEIPKFFSVNSRSHDSGYLNSQYNPFLVNSDGRVDHLNGVINPGKLGMLSLLNESFIKTNRGDLPKEYNTLTQKAVALNTSPRMKALDISLEQDTIRAAYGDTAFGKSALMARRLLQEGVSVVEVGFNGWDLHDNTHEALLVKLPELDRVLSTLFDDLKRSGLWDNTSIIIMSEFGRTPRLNGLVGRDHWALCWTSVVAGGNFKGGTTIGKTSKNGTSIEDRPISSEDFLCTFLKSLDIDHTVKYTSRNGRPMALAGTPVLELL